VTTVLDDKLISLRLRARPEFLARLAEFLATYGDAERAALVVQAAPTQDGQDHSIAVEDINLQNRFREGVTTDNGWWQGFRSQVAVIPTFHGIASLPAREQPAWASEMHYDGHFIAGVWSFPEGNFIVDFYAEMLTDFLRLIENVVGPDLSYDVTWTLTNASRLQYKLSRSRLLGTSIRPVPVQHLQAPIRTEKVGTPGWRSLGMRMQRAFTGAYGDVPRVST
jgi:hypothetical protein